MKKNEENNKVIPMVNDRQIRENAIKDDNGNYLSLQDGRSRWQFRKGNVVDFAKTFYALGSEELKKARENNSLHFDDNTGEVLVDSVEAKRYFSKSNRMLECGLRLDFKVDSMGGKKLNNAYFCRDRLCPICMWRLSRRLAWETNQIIDKYITECPNMIPIMISLTVKNPVVGDLSKMLDVLCHGKSGAWQLLQKWLARREIKDYIRTVEVTYNDVTKTWHPHIHVLAFVPQEYFSKDNSNYITHDILGDVWKRVCKLDYTPVVDIRRCYDKNTENERINFDSDIKTVNFATAIKETAKYCVKPLKLFYKANGDGDNSNLENIELNITTKDLVRELDGALYGRRLRALGGKLKEIAQELKFNQDEEKKDLIHTDDNIMIDEAIWKEIYEYVFEDKDYYLTSREKIILIEKKQEQEDVSIDFQENIEVDNMSIDEMTALLRERKQTDEDINKFLDFIKSDVIEYKDFISLYGEYLMLQYGTFVVMEC